VNVDVLVPALTTEPVEALVERLAAAPRGEPWADEHLALCGALSKALMTDPRARRVPELVTLGYFLRPAALNALRQRFRARGADDVVEVPQGLVFHVPPANVDTIFVYSWALSLLAGNANVLRLSERASPVVDVLCELLCEVLAAPSHAAARGRVAMVRYGHETAITEALSARADLRVIWGGDATVDAIRRVPIPAYATELTFSDRWSLSLLDAEAVDEVDAAGLERLVEGLFNDAYWFDQLGCSSPRLVVWRGSPEAADRAGQRLWPALAALVEARGQVPDPATRMTREVAAHTAVLEGPVTRRTFRHPALDVLRLAELDDVAREHPGGGFFYEVGLPSLAPLVGFLGRRDQTLTHYGIPPGALRQLVRDLGGRGLDRIVPVGEALSMGRLWDGHDLLRAFVRHVHLVA